MWNVVFWNALCLTPIATDIVNKILLGRRYDESLFIYLFIYLFKVRWNDHFMSCFSPIYRYRINTNILH